MPQTPEFPANLSGEVSGDDAGFSVQEISQGDVAFETLGRSLQVAYAASAFARYAAHEIDQPRQSARYCAMAAPDCLPAEIMAQQSGDPAIELRPRVVFRNHVGGVATVQKLKGRRQESPLIAQLQSLWGALTV